MCLATDTIYRTDSKSKRYTIQQYRRSSSYKVVMYIEKLFYQPIPAEYHKTNTTIPKD